jgi:kinesin family protein 22
LVKGEPRIPFRDSKLTRLLQDSLGGNSHSVMITNIAPSMAYFADTLNTLNFASKSKSIVNKPIANVVQSMCRCFAALLLCCLLRFDF